MIEGFLKMFSKQIEPKQLRMSDEDIEIIKYLSESGESSENISLALDKSVPRINYEIKQLSNLKEIK